MNIDVPRLLQGLGIQYRAKGRRLWARCPSTEHDDQDPSWFAWSDPGERRNGRHRCYGCGFSGDAVDLVAEVLGLSPREAREWLEDGGLDAPLLEVELVVTDARRERPEVPADVVFGRSLAEWPTVFRREMQRRRLGDEAVARWGIGYAARGRLRGRVVLPVFDEQRQAVMYQARTVIGSDLRYLDPHGARPHVYGCHLWPPPGEGRGRVVVVEGPFDAIAVDDASRLPVGALLGSEVHPSQLLALSTFRRVTVLTDPDQAGDKAAAALAGLRRWTELERVELPKGEDPDSLPRGELARLLRFGT